MSIELCGFCETNKTGPDDIGGDIFLPSEVLQERLPNCDNQLLYVCSKCMSRMFGNDQYPDLCICPDCQLPVINENFCKCEFETEEEENEM